MGVLGNLGAVSDCTGNHKVVGKGKGKAGVS